jgi:hypothetical protein
MTVAGICLIKILRATPFFMVELLDNPPHNRYIDTVTREKRNHS